MSSSPAVASNTFYYIFDKLNLVPKDILEDDNLIIRIYIKYKLGFFEYRKVPPVFFKCRLNENFTGQNCIVALVNPSDELRTYLALLGIHLVLEDTPEPKIPINELFESAEFAIISRKF